MFAGIKWVAKLAALFIISAFFVFVSAALADEEAEASLSATPEVVNSYNLFWPLVAGKTEADSLYSLKILKETVRGWVVFGDSKKVDYAILLGTKRVLEAEKLLDEGKSELAIKTLSQAEARFGEAYDLAKKARANGKLLPQEVRRDRLVNVKLLADHLKTGAPSEVSTVLEKVKNKANLLLSDYLAKNKDSRHNI